MTAFSVGVGSAQAALVSRADGAAYYDNVLDITWLTNANLAKSTSFGVAGIGSDGSMSWSTATSWVTAMNNADYLGVSVWRLPTLTPVNGVSFNGGFSVDGSTDGGYNYTGTQSEMAYNFYTNLQGTAQFDASTGYWNDNWGLLNGIAPFANVQWQNTTRSYWSGLATSPDNIGAWVFGYAAGAQGTLATPEIYGNKGFAWAVASGDVFAPSEVPVPAAAWLFGSALLGLGRIARRRA